MRPIERHREFYLTGTLERRVPGHAKPVTYVLWPTDGERYASDAAAAAWRTRAADDQRQHQRATRHAFGNLGVSYRDRRGGVHAGHLVGTTLADGTPGSGSGSTRPGRACAAR